jgi:hypothetical protein
MADQRVQTALLGTPIANWPARTAIYIDLNGTLVWGGIVYTVKFDSPSATVTIGGNDFWSYFSQCRRIITDLSYTSIDTVELASAFINLAQEYPGGDIGVTVPTITSGVYVNYSVSGSQYTQIGQAMQNVAQQSGQLGFDYMIDVAYDSNGIPQKFFNPAYPRRGRIAGSTGLVFDVGSTYCNGYSWPIDGSTAANTVYGVGNGTGDSALRQTAAYEAAIDGGYPLLEDSVSRTDITDPTILAEITLAYLATKSLPIALPVLTFSLDMPDPVFGSWIVGDDVRIVIAPDEFFTSGLDEYWRITQYQATVNDDGVSTVALTLSLPPLVF